ncbi:MAG TPA: MFS transporter, partial [Steroidobacter sp.]|nr:MFS transporter [Steroidobacter sp.]
MPTPLKKDARTIALVGLAHGLSHFFHMLLPPLFPLFIQDFGFSYSQLGLLVTIFFVVSGVGQAAAGFVVDRIGARPVL